MSRQYSEEDLQSYAQGNFTGNVDDLTSFIAQNPAAAESVELYKQLFAAFGTVYSADHDPVNLPVKVASLVHAKLAAKQAREGRWLTTGIGALVLAAIAIFIRNIVPGIPAYALPAAGAVVVIGLFVWLAAKIEIDERKRIFTFPAS